jgi:bacterioferritin (cytochrome b1)
MKKNTIFEDAYLIDINQPQTRWEELKSIYSVNNRPTDPDKLNEMIKTLLAISAADEQLAELNYLYSYSLEKTEGKADFDPEFEQHEEEERQHKYDLINRLRELDAKVIFVPIEQMIYFNSIGVEWKQEFSENSRDVILRRLEEEEHAVEFYGLATEFVRGTSDTTTYSLFKKIKEDEEKHVKDLRDLAREYDLI